MERWKDLAGYTLLGMLLGMLATATYFCNEIRP